MNRNFEVRVAVFVAVVRDNQVLLCRRQNTDWLDGYYDLPSGHLEPGETLPQTGMRELKEETGLLADEEDLELFHICQNYMNRPYINFTFKVNRWSGESRIMEPHLSDDQGFFPLDHLPTNTLPYVIKALGQLGSKSVSFSYFSAEDLPPSLR